MRVAGIVNADGSASTGIKAALPAVGTYAITVSGIPKARRRVRVDLLWQGGTSNGLVAQYAPDYSDDTTVVVIVSTPGNPGTKVDASFAFDVELMP